MVPELGLACTNHSPFGPFAKNNTSGYSNAILADDTAGVA